MKLMEILRKRRTVPKQESNLIGTDWSLLAIITVSIAGCVADFMYMISREPSDGVHWLWLGSLWWKLTSLFILLFYLKEPKIASSEAQFYDEMPNDEISYRPSAIPPRPDWWPKWEKVHNAYPPGRQFEYMGRKMIVKYSGVYVPPSVLLYADGYPRIVAEYTDNHGVIHEHRFDNEVWEILPMEGKA